jgi:hypothetical protein
LRRATSTWATWRDAEEKKARETAAESNKALLERVAKALGERAKAGAR